MPSNQNLAGAEGQTRQANAKDNKLFVVVTVSVLLTATIVGSAVYFWQKSVNDEVISSLEQKVASLEEQISTMENVATQPSKRSISPPPSIAKSTANWKTYNSENLGFTFRYPPSVIKIKTGDVNRLGPAVSLVTESKYSQVQEENVDITPIVIYVGNVNSVRQDYYYGGYKWTKAIIDSLSSLNVNETKQGAKENITKKGSIIIDGVQASKFIVNPNEGEAYVGVALIRGDSSYLFVYFPSKSNITETTFSQILSTFKFTN
jgi:hypothetical protein